MSPPPPPSSHTLQAPTGTRDFYPAELARLRYLQAAWRATSIRHGFDEIDGPTFEHLELFTVKSGDAIVSELFSFTRSGGEKTYALRPEFTPTLARLFAAKAASLPKPTRWFWMQNCFRAERPQRGRLREFQQWNCDILGDPSAAADAELIATCVELLRSLGLSPSDVRVCFSDRRFAAQILGAVGVKPDLHMQAFELLDKRGKVSDPDFAQSASRLGLDLMSFDSICKSLPKFVQSGQASATLGSATIDLTAMVEFRKQLEALGILEWCDMELSIVRGLAYYTGMVFEVHEATGAERAIAGGGRYDNLIELFGGPPTPAVGFGMGDVVLSLVLQDKGLIPTDDQIADRLGLRPDVFVIGNGTDEADAAVTGVAAQLRRAGLHARRTNKTTKNIGKLLKDASTARARFCLILESPERGTLKSMDSGDQMPDVAPGDVASRISALVRS